MLIFHTSCNNMFIKTQCGFMIRWNGEFIGEIKDFANKIPALKGKRLFLLYPANQYISLEPYTFINHYVECIKVILGMNSLPFNTCTYKNKQYIVYDSYPEYDTIYCLSKKNSNDINDEERKIYLFHWLLGLRGKFMCRRTTDGYIYYSRSGYGNFNPKRNDISKAAIKKLFGGINGYDEIKRVLLLFLTRDRIYNLRCFLETHNYEWFYNINQRINLFINDYLID